MTPVDPNKARWLKEVRLGGYRSFGPEPQTVRLWREEGKPCQWTLILGDNGTGKSTLLDFAFWAAWMSRSNFTAYVNRSIPTELDFSFHRWGDQGEARRGADLTVWDISHISAENSCVAIYGPDRSNKYSQNMPKTQPEVGAEDSVFHGEMRDAQAYLAANVIAQKTKDSSIDFADLVSKALPGNPVIDVVESGSRHFADYEVIFQMPSGPTPFRSLGQGYIAQITFIIDFASRMVETHPNLKNPFQGPAVCLIDEIDLHMHPKWQRQIIQHLSETFPNTQFIATAHSPLIVQGADEANLVLLRRSEEPDGDGNRFTIIDNDIDYVTGWRLDQLVTSDLFGLDSPRSVSAAEKVAEQRSLLKSFNRTEEEDARLTSLNTELDKLPPGDTAEQARAAMELAEKMRQTLDLFEQKGP